jgi:hypothetical protein
MGKHVVIPFFLLSAFLCAAAGARETNILNQVSPKLQQFLMEHPTALRPLTNVLSAAFADRTLRLYYLYSDDESVPRASHDYPEESVVAIFIRENQQPSDEFISLLFEAQNSTSEKQFLNLCAEATSGSISKNDFAQDFGRLEFDAAKRTRDFLKDIKMGRGEINKSHYYKLFRAVPDDFEEFLIYTKNVSSPPRDLIKEYEAKYDLLRKEAPK